MKIKNKIKIFFFTSLSIVFLGLPFGVSSAPGQTAGQLGITAFVLSSDSDTLPNGKYDVRFAIYTADRQNLDPYPSNSDQAFQIWQETQTVDINNGLLNAYLGANNPLPPTLTFSNGDYYLGVMIGNDSEMIPRKKIASVPTAFNSNFLQGKTIGNQVGEIPLISTTGTLDSTILKNINQVGTITAGTWQGKALADKYIANTLTGKTYNGVNLSGSNTLTVSVDATIDQNLSTTSNIIFNTLNLTNALNPINGGTGFSTFALGDLLYGQSGNQLTKLNIGSANQVLSVTGGLPAWRTIDLSAALLGILPFASGGTGSTDFTAGGVIFSDGTKLTQNNLSFFWDDTNNRLGIGTTAPTQILHVAGNMRLTGGLYDSTNSVGTSGMILSSTGSATEWIKNAWTMSGSNTLLAVASMDPATAYPSTARMTDAFRNWSGIAMSSTGQYQTAVGWGERIYVSSDYGDTWTPKDSVRDWVSVAMSSDGSRQTAVEYGGQIYISTDSGV
ncbi:MAG: hypothetical protein WCF93_05165, partial [Candidatus Moraniibacteriota bacterium]